MSAPLPTGAGHAPLRLLYDAAVALGRARDEGEALRELMRQARRALGASAVVVARPGAEGSLEGALALRGADDGWGAPVALDAAEAEVAALAARTGRPARADAAALLAAPLLAGHALVGVVVARGDAPFGAADEELFGALAAIAAPAVRTARSEAESRRERRQSEALADVASAVGTSLRLDEVLRLTLRHAAALLHAEGAYAALRSGEFLEVVAATGRAEVLAGLYLPDASSLTGEVLGGERPLVVNDLVAHPRVYRPAQRAAQVQRIVVVPLVTAGGTIGALAVVNRDAPFDDTDARILRRLADHAAVAIVNARLFGEVEQATREWAVAFDAIASGMTLLDAEGRITRANARAAELAGRVDARALIGLPLVAALLHDGADSPDAADAARLLAATLRDGRVARGTVRAPARGRLFDVVASPHPHGGAVVTFDDVTAVHALAERHRLVVETARDAIVVTGPSRRIELANPAAEALFARPGGLVGAPVSELVPPELADAVAARTTAALGGEPQRYETVIVRGDGERRIVSVNSAPFPEPGGPPAVLAALRDVTEERERALALARSELRFARLFEAAPDGVCTLDAEGRLLEVNPSFCRALGVGREALLGRFAVDLVEPEERTAVHHLIASTLAGQRVRGELRFHDRNARPRVAAVFTAPLSEEGRVTGALALVRDVTDERLRAAQVLQREKLAALGQLVSGVAHELNNPLAAVVAFSQLLLAQEPADPEQRHAVATIHAEARRAARIVSDLLTFARRRDPVRGSVNLNTVARTVADLRRYALRAQQIELELDLDPDLPPTRADEHQLHQVVLNLVTNGEQALRDWDGGRRITIRTRRDGERLTLSVADTGPGVDPARRNRIFDPFYTTKPVGQGTGLGLSIADAIVRGHGGRLTVDSARGAGAVFTMELPLLAPDADDEPGADAAPSEAARGAAAAPRSVLVVDDEASVRQALARFLTREGFAVDAVPGGREALRQLESATYDAILLDLRMPDLPGDQVFERLRARDPGQAARVVFVTGDVRDERTREFLEATGCPVLGKPFLLEDVAEAIRARVDAR